MCCFANDNKPIYRLKITLDSLPFTALLKILKLTHVNIIITHKHLVLLLDSKSHLLSTK